MISLKYHARQYWILFNAVVISVTASLNLSNAGAQQVSSTQSPPPVSPEVALPPGFKLIAASVFTLFLLIFFAVAFFQRDEFTAGKFTILRLMSAICAGLAGALFTGEALFTFTSQTGGTNLAVSGAAGCALFFTVWFLFKVVTPPDSTPKYKNSMSVSIPDGWTFRQLIETLVKSEKGFVDFVGFTSEELNTRLQPRDLQISNLVKEMPSLRHLTLPPGEIPPYEVTLEDSVYRLTVRNK